MSWRRCSIAPQRPAFDAQNLARQGELRTAHGRKQEKPLLSWEQAKANRLRLDYAGYVPPVPAFLGRRSLDVPLPELIPLIDWTFFFTAWELKGRYPQIFEHPAYGHAARELYDHARSLLDRIVADGTLRARGVYGFWPANGDGEDLVLYEDDTRATVVARFPMLRQQNIIADGRPNRLLVDFVAPTGSGVADYVGAFAVTAGLGADALVKAFEAQHDDYQAILVKALADRLAEAFAEYMHARARRDWGFGADEKLSNDDLIDEAYRGIRPAFGYPACPDHTEKGTLFELLDAPAIGMSLTESFAMLPPASVSGLYFSHPDARYFMVGRLGRDQVTDYAARKRGPLEDVERWLVSDLAYSPEPQPVAV